MKNDHLVNNCIWKRSEYETIFLNGQKSGEDSIIAIASNFCWCPFSLSNRQAKIYWCDPVFCSYK